MIGICSIITFICFIILAILIVLTFDSILPRKGKAEPLSEADRKGFKYVAAVTTTVMIFSGTGLMYGLNQVAQEKNRQNQIAQEVEYQKQIQKSKPTDYNGKKDLIMNLYDDTMRKTTTYYSRLELSDKDILTVYVNGEKLPKEERAEYYDRCIELWYLIAQAQSGNKVNDVTFRVMIIDENSGRTLKLMSADIFRSEHKKIDIGDKISPDVKKYVDEHVKR